MSQTVTAPRIGVTTTESAQNAATHGPKDRSAVHGVTLTESMNNAVLNTQSANE